MKTEKELDFLETLIPQLAESAMEKAYVDALSSGQSVLQDEDGKIYEVFPDGRKQLRKTIAPRISVKEKKWLLQR